MRLVSRYRRKLIMARCGVVSALLLVWRGLEGSQRFRRSVLCVTPLLARISWSLLRESRQRLWRRFTLRGRRRYHRAVMILSISAVLFLSI